ncbi:MAG: hypothetical protein QXT25_03890 [Candidatus Anstonellaceae archaeon]
MRGLTSVLLLLVLSGLAFSLWTASLNISVVDLAGKPVDKAQVSVTYQKASQISETDGFISGETNPNGIFSAMLSNRVPEPHASRNIQVKVSTIYWQGETKKFTINESESRPILFVVPFRLEEYFVRVLSAKDEPVRGADVVIAGKIPIKKQTTSDGRARFLFPQNFSFSGYASYMNASTPFNSSSAAKIDNRTTIVVKLPPLEGEVMGSVAGSGKHSVAVVFLGLNGTALAEKRVSFSFEGKNYSLYTDSDGFAGFLYDKNGTLNITIREYDYDYRFSLNLTEGNNTTVELKLYPLLRIISADSAPKKQLNCFDLFANVSDPRNLSLRVRMLAVQGQKQTALKVNNTSSSFFVSEVCITADTRIKITASNKYETAEAALNLSFVRPQMATPANLNMSSQQVKPKQQETDDMVVVAAVLFASTLAAFFFARAYLAQSARFIIEYIRKTKENLDKRRKKPQIPPAIPTPPPEQPAQP